MSVEASKRIAQNRESRATVLDLSKTGLTELPSELRGMPWIEKLDISGNPIANLDALAALHQLAFLDAHSTRVADLGPLAGLRQLKDVRVWSTQVIDLAALAGLPILARLEIDFTMVADLWPLAHSSKLTELSMMRTACTDLTPLSGISKMRILGIRGSLVHDLEPLLKMRGVIYLDLSESQVTDLRPILGMKALNSLNLTHLSCDLSMLSQLTSLRTLDLRGGSSEQVRQLGALTQLGRLDLSAPAGALDPLDQLDIAPLQQLGGLRRLGLMARGVTDLSPLRHLIDGGLPVLWTADSSQDGIHVKDCPLVTPPAEIASQGPDAVLNFFRELDGAGVDHLYEAKLLLLGEGRAGKTSLLRRLFQPDRPLPGEDETTKGIEIHRHAFQTGDGHDFRLNVWDFGGQEIYHATHQFFLTRRSLYVLLDDTAKDHRTVSDEGFKYWLDLVDVFGGRSPVIIFQNEKGGRSKTIDLAGIKGRFENVLERFAGDLSRDGSANKVRDAIEWHASQLGHVGEEVPARWVRLRAAIEESAASHAHISQQEYFDLYARYMPFDATKALHLSRYLHDLGVFLHFQDDPLLKRTVILRNSWATEAVFRILDSETVKRKNGQFGETDCAEAWCDSTYADMHPELLALMQRFEMCYALPDSKTPTWLAPLLLPPSKPAALEGWARADDLVLRYHYEFMPKGLIGRLTVRLHRYLQDIGSAWATGALFSHADTETLVERLPAGGQLELRARGVDRKALLSVIAGELDALNQSFDRFGGRVYKLIPCNCDSCRASQPPEFFDYRNLLKRREVGQATAECQRSFKPISVDSLLDGISGAGSAPDHRKGEADMQKPPRTLKIFLASSSELAADRDAFELHFRRLNDELLASGIYLDVVRWEHFLDAMAPDGLQAEYNREIQACDVFVSLFFTKTGRYTEEEFDVAHKHFKTTGTPRLYTYFKNASVDTGTIGKDFLTVISFKEKLRLLNHYHSNYKSVEDLNLQFRDQLKFLREAL